MEKPIISTFNNFSLLRVYRVFGELSLYIPYFIKGETPPIPLIPIKVKQNRVIETLVKVKQITPPFPMELSQSKFTTGGITWFQ